MSNSIPLLPGNYYHIYNRGNNRENIFLEPRNYLHFLKLYTHHVATIVHTYAYCLLKNHFHLLIQVKTEEDLKNLPGLQDLAGFDNLSAFASQSFSNLFNAYTKSFNNAYGRTGSLFQKPFRRHPVTSDAYFVHLVNYIHQNPQKHGFVDNVCTWPYSSYTAILSDKPTQLRRDIVLEWFTGRTNFIEVHRQQPPERQLTPLIGEDDD